MEKRLYQSVEPRYSYVDKRDGLTFGSIIKGDNTVISITNRLQKSNQLVFTIEFLDLKSTMCIKVKEERYVKYALSQMNKSMYEYYKTALLMCKNHIKKMWEVTEYSYNKFLNGEYSFPINKDNHLTYLDSINDYKSIYDSIDVVEADLYYLQQTF